MKSKVNKATVRFIQVIFVSIISLLSIDIWAQDQGLKKITLEDIWYSSTFRSKAPSSFKGMANGESYCLLSKKEGYVEVHRYSISTGEKEELLFSTKEIKQDGKVVPMQSFEFSEDENWVLIKFNIRPIYRHSSTCDAVVLNRKTQNVIALPKGIMYPSISPDGSNIAYVKDFNLYVKGLKANTTEKAISSDGKKNEIRNGLVDWVYEEEFGMDVGFFWSPNSRHIAYYRFNEQKVPFFTMDIYGSLYPQRETWKYPKAGEVNSKVDVFIYDLTTNTSVQCKTNSENDQYLPRIHWDLEGKYLAIQRLNRHQNKLEILFADPLFGSTEIKYQEENKYYIEVHDWIPIEGGKWLFLSEQSGYKHLWCFEPGKSAEGKSKAITKGEFDVADFYGYDPNSNMAYFNAGVLKATERQIYGVDISKGKLKQLSSGDGWHRATFIKGYKYYLENYSKADVPSIHSLRTSKGELVKVLEDNQGLRETLTQYDLSKSEFGTFKNRYGMKLDYWMMKPTAFDSSKSYPVLFYVYGGPGYQTAKNAWGGANYLWYQMLAQQGYIIITVNNTGGGAQGEAFKKKTYLQLGNYETQDYIDAAKHFGSKSFINAERIGIWGWSYGGYMSSNCITRGANFFKAAIAVAPVTSWRYYDNIYTERYMRTPQENPQGYDTNSPINHVSKLKGQYLLVHGTADDNVHFQNATELMMALNNANIPYESAVYPNRNHGIYGGKTRLHLYTKMTRFILSNL